MQRQLERCLSECINGFCLVLIRACPVVHCSASLADRLVEDEGRVPLVEGGGRGLAVHAPDGALCGIDVFAELLQQAVHFEPFGELVATQCQVANGRGLASDELQLSRGDKPEVATEALCEFESGFEQAVRDQESRGTCKLAV